MDGVVTSYQDGTNTWIFTTMRRGGRAVYAFDVSDMAKASPTPPSLLWWTGCPDNFSSSGTTVDTNCKANMSDFGQTWSALKVLKAESYKVGTAYKPMLIMGGGYDVCEDGDPGTCTNSTKGDGIYVLDAATGDYLNRLDTERAVVGDVFVVTDSAGRAKWAYAADMAGNVYRIHGANANTDLGQTAPTGWQITRIASLGCDSGSSCSEKRKFMFAPDVTRIGEVYYLMLGSGDREKPLYNFDNAYEVDNLFVMIKDNPTKSDWLTSENGTCNDNVLCLESLFEIGVNDPTPPQVELDEVKGWYLRLRDHEQVVTSAITVFGVTTFSTHTPEPEVGGACESKLGTARVYNVFFRNAGPAYKATDRSAEVEGGGLPPSPVAGIVRLDDGREVPFVIGADPDSPLESKLPDPPSLGSKPKSLTYWYLEKGKIN
jgi:type IV pilus assembly protein PilY1